MMKIYGSMLCKDCVVCRKDLDQAGVAYEFLDFADNLMNLKIFLSFRDKESLFSKIRESGKIGIPCIVDDGGNVFLEWDRFL